MTGQFKYYNHDERDPYDLIPFLEDARTIALILAALCFVLQ